MVIRLKILTIKFVYLFFAILIQLSLKKKRIIKAPDTEFKSKCNNQLNNDQGRAVHLTNLCKAGLEMCGI